MRRMARIGCVLALSVLLGACGVPLQGQPTVISPSLLPIPLPVPDASPSVSAALEPSARPPMPTPAAARVRLWFVVDDGLAPSEMQFAAEPTPEGILQALGDAPTDGDGMRTIARDPLSGESLVAVESMPGQTGSDAGGVLRLRLRETFTALPPSEQVLLLGQIVLTLAGAGWSAITFTDASGAQLAVPLPDGRLLDVPATARDYAPLIIRP